jgi:hypothetical protein
VNLVLNARIRNTYCFSKLHLVVEEITELSLTRLLWLETFLLKFRLTQLHFVRIELVLPGGTAIVDLVRPEFLSIQRALLHLRHEDFRVKLKSAKRASPVGF